MNQLRKHQTSAPYAVKHERGFLLIVVIGLLAVLLLLCISFLTFTRGEVTMVANLRDKTDASDLALSAVDWTIASIAHDLIDSKSPAPPGLMPGQFRFDLPMSRTNNYSSDPNYKWWYKVLMPGASTLEQPQPPKSYPYPYWSQKDEAVWTYCPVDYFQGGGIRGRFCVHDMDTNAFININNWKHCCNPSQCQMAHMFCDGLGGGNMEANRFGWVYVPKVGPPSPGGRPLRYRECWRVVTRTQCYNLAAGGGAPVSVAPSLTPGTLPPAGTANWYTTNQSWFWSDSGVGNIIYTQRLEEKIPQNSGSDWSGQLPSFTGRSYVDPDTGRSPVNVNTVFNSGENVPTGPGSAQVGRTLEAVFNIDSLRRIVKIGRFDGQARGLPRYLAGLAQADARPAAEGPKTTNTAGLAISGNTRALFHGGLCAAGDTTAAMGALGSL
jgi:hypothetical protein